MAGDTHPDVEQMLLERKRRMSPSERFAEGVSLCLFARQMMRSGIRMRHPEYDEQQVEQALARLLWGDELYRAAKPDWPLLDP